MIICTSKPKSIIAFDDGMKEKKKKERKKKRNLQDCSKGMLEKRC